MKKITNYLALLIGVILVFTSCGSGDNSSSENQSLQSEVAGSVDAVESTEDSSVETGNVSDSESADASNASGAESADASDASEDESIDASDASEETSQSPADRGEFYVYYTEGEVDFSKAPKAEILNYPWGEEYMPYAYGQVIFKKDDGFYIHMYCEESNPQTTIMENGGSVYLDSCLEFFCEYRPKKFAGGNRYINLEMNSAGVYLANYNGIPVDTLSTARITVESEKADTYWTVTAHVPLKLIEDIYGSVPTGIGNEIKCNFTKCGSGTAIPHYGSWQPLGGETPNFHQPRYFETVHIA